MELLGPILAGGCLQIGRAKKAFSHWRLENVNFLPNFYRKNNSYVSADAQQGAEQNMSAITWRSEEPMLRYLPSNLKISHSCPSGTEVCDFGQKLSIWAEGQQDKVL